MDMQVKQHQERLDNWGTKPKNIFIGSAADMWIEAVPDLWLREVLAHCRDYSKHLYLFLTKYPYRYVNMLSKETFPPRCILGTTIETNRSTIDISKAIPTLERLNAMVSVREVMPPGMQTMISIEPILQFDVEAVVQWVEMAKPDYVSIGADSKNCGLAEPTSMEVCQLIYELKDITEVRVKRNLFRLVQHRFFAEEWLERLHKIGIKHPDIPDETKVVKQPPAQLLLL